MTSVEVRSKLVEALELDLVGPRPGLEHRGRGPASVTLALVFDRVSGSD